MADTVSHPAATLHRMTRCPGCGAPVTGGFTITVDQQGVRRVERAVAGVAKYHRACAYRHVEQLDRKQPPRRARRSA